MSNISALINTYDKTGKLNRPWEGKILLPLEKEDEVDQGGKFNLETQSIPGQRTV